jgi:hypothetical protein
MRAYLQVFIFTLAAVISGSVFASGSCLGLPLPSIPGISAGGDPSIGLPPPVTPPPVDNNSGLGNGTPPSGTNNGGGGTVTSPGSGTNCGNNAYSFLPSTCSTSGSCGADGRQTSGAYVTGVHAYGDGYSTSTTGSLESFSDVWGTTNPSAIPGSGYDVTFNVTAGCFISLQFTPTSAGELQMAANETFGTGGSISVSDEPGEFGNGTSGVLCSVSRGAANEIIIAPSKQATCPVVVGNTYYLNLSCGGASNPSCDLDYTVYTAPITNN